MLLQGRNSPAPALPASLAARARPWPRAPSVRGARPHTGWSWGRPFGGSPGGGSSRGRSDGDGVPRPWPGPPFGRPRLYLPRPRPSQFPQEIASPCESGRQLSAARTGPPGDAPAHDVCVPWHGVRAVLRGALHPTVSRGSFSVWHNGFSFYSNDNNHYDFTGPPPPGVARWGAGATPHLAHQSCRRAPGLTIRGSGNLDRDGPALWVTSW